MYITCMLCREESMVIKCKPQKRSEVSGTSSRTSDLFAIRMDGQIAGLYVERCLHVRKVVFDAAVV